MSNQEHLNDLFDTRAEIRRLQKAVKDTRAAALEAKSELAEATKRAEGILTEMEQRQGRLAFDDATTPPKKKGRPRKAASEPAAAADRAS
jgi:hypothetical protein